jgi:fibro-slime domain-containing protein
MNLPPEECDDSNVQDGDGCSHQCKIEKGFTCTDAALEPPSQLNLLATYRDVISFPTTGNQRHPDFEIFGESTAHTPDLVKPVLGATGKPVMEGRCAKAGVSVPCPFGQQFTTSAHFDQWYQDTPGVNIAVPGTLRLPRLADGSYVFDSNTEGFYPVDGKGFVASPAKEKTTLADAVVNDGGLHNFGFTTEIRYFFQYRGGEILTFSGDDDVWIFINRRLALDLGGLHPRLEETLFVDQAAATLGLVKNGLYEIALFHAERHSTASNFMLTLTGFSPASSHCKPTCGDGVVIPPEACDLGKDRNTGDYNVCTPECRLGPRCGDGVLQTPEESCDDGINLTTYAASSKPACAPGCVPSGFCGDGIVDGQFGEQCDLGTAKNSGEYGGCTATCALGPRCGDGVVDEDHHEQCDDGNTVSGDLCTNNCQWQIIL